MPLLTRRLGRRLRKWYIRLIVHDASLCRAITVFGLLLFMLRLCGLGFLPRYITEVDILVVFLRYDISIYATESVHMRVITRLM